jgi:hypothetical protein
MSAPLSGDLDDRYRRRSTVLSSQLPVARGHKQIGHPTIADSILDRLAHSAYRYSTANRSARSNEAGHEQASTGSQQSTGWLRPDGSSASRDLVHHIGGEDDLNSNKRLGEFCYFSNRILPAIARCTTGFTERSIYRVHHRRIAQQDLRT